MKIDAFSKRQLTDVKEDSNLKNSELKSCNEIVNELNRFYLDELGIQRKGAFPTKLAADEKIRNLEISELIYSLLYRYLFIVT